MELSHLQIVERDCADINSDSWLVVVYRKDGEGTIVATKPYKSYATAKAKELSHFFGIPVK